MSLPDPVDPDDIPTAPSRPATPVWLRGVDATDDEATHESLSEATGTGAESPGERFGGRPSVLDEGEPARRGGPVPWTAAASSVPQLNVSREPSRGDGHSSPEAEENGNLEEDLEVFPGVAETSDPDERAGATETAMAPLHEPWWLVWMDALATHRRVQLSIAAGLVVLGAVVLWPRGQGSGDSLARIKHDPAAYEGRSVRVRGRVGDVFSVGKGYVFHLHQGRDTVVVFTQSRTPEIHDRVEIVGAVSTGFLDGAPRVAIFEAPPSKP